MTKHWLALLLIVLAVSCPAGHGAEPATDRLPVVTVAVESNWPPMEFRDADGTLTGFSIDFMRAVAREAGFVPVFRDTTWDTIFDGLLDGEYDVICSSVSITAERLRDMDFSIPYFSVRQALLVKRSLNIRSTDDMEDLRLGVQMGTTGHILAENLPHVDLVVYNDIITAFAAMANLDGIICDDPVAAAHALESQNDDDPLVVALLFDSPEPEEYGFAVRQGRPDLVELLNKGILRVRENGIETALHRKWLSRGSDLVVPAP